MADGVYIKVEGLDPLIRQLTELGKLKSVKAALKSAASHVKSKIAPYPPATVANLAGNPSGRWYERGYGPKWMTRTGVHGRKTSETLGRRWSTKFYDNDFSVVLGNNASYNIYVHDKEEQASFHAARGWKTVQDVAEQETPAVRGFIAQYLQAEIDRGPTK